MSDCGPLRFFLNIVSIFVLIEVIFLVCLFISYRVFYSGVNTNFRYLEQNADGRGHAHHANTDHGHLAPGANRLLLHHVVDELLLGGHL